MAFSSSSSSLTYWERDGRKEYIYDVFLSYSGEETSRTFVNNLYEALLQRGILTKLQRFQEGKEIRDESLKYIDDSGIFIIVFTKKYASSSWCLDELVKIMERQKATTDLIVFLMFYEVEPHEVRKQSGPVGEAFANHTNHSNKKLEEWRMALKDATNLFGLNLRDSADGQDAKVMINLLVEGVARKLRLFDENLRYRLKDMLSATNNFSHENLIKEGALGNVYRGLLSGNRNWVVRRLICKYGQKDDLQTEISRVKSLRHKNVVSFHGLCDENNENIIIYKAYHGTLNQHLRDPTLTWPRRLRICLGVARGLNHIHYDIIHCDINSSKIILDKEWEPKIFGFELSTEYPQSWRHRLRFSRYFDTNNLTPKYDVYSFGVLLLEVVCGRKPMITNDGIQEEVDEIIDPKLREQMATKTLKLFTGIAYKCINQQPVERPTMDQVVKELEEVLERQREHATDLELSKAADEGTSSNNLKIPLREIRRATNGFSKVCFVGSGGYADVYKAKLDFLNIEDLSDRKRKRKDELPKISKTVAIKRIKKRPDEQGEQGFLAEIELLTSCKHPNIVSLLGFCRESGEMILVYEYAFEGSLSNYLVSTVILTWAQRLQICLDIAHAINYLHTDMEGKPRIIHRDIKSDNILLDENLNAKVADFGLSKSHHMSQQSSSVLTENVVGTKVYLDPEFLATGKYKRESDIYSFGVVLFEVLSGRMAYDSVYTNENDLGLAPIARRRFNEETIKELIDPRIKEDDDDCSFTLNKGPNQDSFHTFSKIAYQCLAETQVKRPTIKVVINELENALKLQGETVVLTRSRLSDIVSATQNFVETYRVGLDTIGMVYKSELEIFLNDSLSENKGKDNSEPSKKQMTVAIKRITTTEGRERKQELFDEIEMHACKHPNIVPLIGFCDEGDEMVVIYEHVSDTSLDHYLKSVDNIDNFTWTHRLHMCLEIARGLDHLHTKMINESIIRSDIKSANILLGKKREAKIAYFVISKLHPTYEDIEKKVYEDPEYETTGKLEKKSDVYSFGVVLFEIFCGRVAYDPIYIKENGKGLAPIACQCYVDETIDKIIDPKLNKEIFSSNREGDKSSLDTFLKLAYRCLGIAAKRPTMKMVIKELETSLNFHIQPEYSQERSLLRSNQFLYGHANGLSLDEFKPVTKEICMLPSFFSSILFKKIDADNTGAVTRDAFVDFWVNGNMLTKDITTQIFTLLQRPDMTYLTQEDFKPILREILKTHPGLEFLESTPEFQERYAETVIYRIFYYVNRTGNGRITLEELKCGNLISAMLHADEEEDINKVLRFFSYEHFYVIFCKFWELDTDHDFLIDKENLIRYGNHALTYRIVDRIFSQVPRKFMSEVEGKMGYEDFVYFILSEEDKSSEPSLEYWFKCIDLDGNGVLTRNELQFFYEEQLSRMECMGQEPVLFENILCQIVDMVKPQDEECFTLDDLKGSKLSGSCFNILFNLNKFMAFKSCDPFLIRQEHENPTLTQWDLFAHREYIRLSMEEDADDASNGSADVWYECLEDASNGSEDVWYESLEAPF